MCKRRMRLHIVQAFSLRVNGYREVSVGPAANVVKLTIGCFEIIHS